MRTTTTTTGTTPTTTTSSTDKLSATHERLVEAIGAITSGEDWRAMLEVSRRFHAYSLSNVLLILAQRPEATRVAGYNAWKALGRQVRRGEHGIAILAPVLYGSRRGEEEPNTAPESPVAATNETGTAPGREDGPGAPRVLRGFRVAHVFDVSQTDGEPLPEVAPVLLQGEAPGAVFERLAVELERSGFNLLRADCSPANGRTHFLSRTVVVRPDLSPAQALKTLVHEVAHTRLHDGSEYATGCRGLVEVEAESVAYLVCSSVGLATGAYSFPYVAQWAKGDLDLVRSTATRVVTCAREVLEAITGEAAGPAMNDADGTAPVVSSALLTTTGA